jgi:16S rRNA (cytosine967-C5)-methyltransferase
VSAPTPSRAAALEILRAVRGGALASRAFERSAHGLPPRDRAWTRELVFGTFRLRGRLDHLLASLSKRPLPQLEPDVLDILRVGAYQLTAMDGVPSYAAVSESVELAKRNAGRGAAGFVNGVLQSLRRGAAASTFPGFAEDPLRHLTTWGSHPEWLVRRWIERFGAEETRRLVEANNRRPQLYVRALGDRDSAVALLRNAGVEIEPVDGAPRALNVVTGAVEDVLAAAPLIVQDPAAGLVVSYAAVPRDALIVDLAAAPGGKTLAMACDEADGPALVVACDLSRGRLRRLEQNVARLHGPAPAGVARVPVVVVVADGRRPPIASADVVLLDAPCTGTGTFRRHPDGRWRIQPRDLAALVRLQAELLSAAADIVADDGLLVYSTCSLEVEENEEQVEAFLKQNPDFGLDTVVDASRDAAALVVEADGRLRVLPQRHGWDGAFAVRLRRRRQRAG